MRSSSVTTSGIGGEKTYHDLARAGGAGARAARVGEVDAGLLLRAKESVGEGRVEVSARSRRGGAASGFPKPCSPTVEKEKIRAGERRTRRAFGRRDVVVRVARALEKYRRDHAWSTRRTSAASRT